MLFRSHETAPSPSASERFIAAPSCCNMSPSEFMSKGCWPSPAPVNPNGIWFIYDLSLTLLSHNEERGLLVPANLCESSAIHHRRGGHARRCQRPRVAAHTYRGHHRLVVFLASPLSPKPQRRHHRWGVRIGKVPPLHEANQSTAGLCAAPFAHDEE